jgi:hypothetical protein
MENNEILITVIGMVSIGLVTGLVVWLSTRNVAAAFVAAIERIMADPEGMDVIEDYYIDNLPPEIRDVIGALLSVAERLADGTTTDADDKLVELLKKLTDGEVNAAALDC